jgi:hypothetical protein
MTKIQTKIVAGLIAEGWAVSSGPELTGNVTLTRAGWFCRVGRGGGCTMIPQS